MVYCHLKYAPKFFFIRNTGISLVTKNKNPVLFLRSKVKLINCIITFRKLWWLHHDKTLERKIPHQIRMIQQTSAHMKPANWTLQTKTFSKLLQFKGSNDSAVEFMGILQLSFSILVKFDLGPIFTFLPLPLWKMTWEASLPNQESPLLLTNEAGLLTATNYFS